MADKILNTRIKLKYDTLDKGVSAKDLILLEGEVAVVAVESKPTQTVDSVTPPQILFKVGDGKHTFAQLPWASGLAADVYAWAKKATPGDSITLGADGTGNAITSLKGDATKHQIIGVKGETFATKAQLDDVAGKIPSGFSIIASATDDDVVVLRGQGGKNKVSYTASHAKKGPSQGYTSENTTTTIGAGENKTIKIPQLTVDTFGHTTKATDQSITITIPSIPSGGGNVIPTDNVSVVDSVSLSGHTLSGSTKKFVGTRGINVTGNTDTITVQGPDLSSYATEEYVDNKVAGSVQYLGLASQLTDLSITAGKGDFYRASATFSGVDSGDLIVALKDNPRQLINETDYAVVKSSDDYKGTVTQVKAGEGLSVDKNTSGEADYTLKHGSPSGASAGAKGSSDDRTYIKTVTTDKFGHVTAVTIGKETITDTKNTTGAADTKQKLYLIGSESQSATPVTYSNKGYSQSEPISVQGQVVGIGGTLGLNEGNFLSKTFYKLKFNADGTTEGVTPSYIVGNFNYLTHKVQPGLTLAAPNNIINVISNSNPLRTTSIIDAITPIVLDGDEFSRLYSENIFTIDVNQIGDNFNWHEIEDNVFQDYGPNVLSDLKIYKMQGAGTGQELGVSRHDIDISNAPLLKITTLTLDRLYGDRIDLNHPALQGAPHPANTVAGINDNYLAYITNEIGANYTLVIIRKPLTIIDCGSSSTNI